MLTAVLALSGEGESYANMKSLFDAIVPDSAPTTRSSSSSNSKKRKINDDAADAEPKITLERTPLDALTVDSLDSEGVWEQMELRNEAVDHLLDDMFGVGGPEAEPDLSTSDIGDDDDDDDASVDEEEEDDGEEMSDTGSEGEEDDFESEEYSRQLNALSEDDESDDKEKEQRTKGKKRLSLDNFDEPTDEGQSGTKKRKGKASAVDDDFFSLADFHQQTDQGEFEMERALRGEVDDDDDDNVKEDDFDLFADPSTLHDDNDDEDDGEAAEGDLDEAGIMYNDFFAPPARLSKRSAASKGAKGSKAPPKTKKRKSPEPESDSVTKTPVIVEQVQQEGGDEQEPLRKKKSAKVRFADEVRVKTIAARKQTEFEKLAAKVGEAKAREIVEDSLLNDDGDDVEFSDDESDQGDSQDDDSQEEEESEEEEDEETLDGEEYESPDQMDEDEEDESEDGEDLTEDVATIDRFKGDLFADDEDEEQGKGLPLMHDVRPAQMTDEGAEANLSKQERRLLALSSQIAALEAENVGPKRWATRGEVKSKDRPVNSLLEEDIEFERAGKVVPVITEETTKTIEDLIKRRILENQFDDVERRRPVDPNAFLPSRYLEVQDTKSGKSLAEIYEEDFVSAKERETGRRTTNALDADLEKKHLEIEALFDDLSAKLDALSNAHFTPKAPQATITTLSNVPAVSLESAMPTTQSTAQRLAPEEVHSVDSSVQDRSDMTPAQKRAERQKRRKERAEQAKKRERFVSDKEKARKALLGTRGVTVLGKGATSTTTATATKEAKKEKKKRAPVDVGTSVALKL